MATNGVSVHPWEIAGAGSELSSQSSASTERYSATNPPRTWTINSQALFSKSSGGSPKQLREFYKGQWREVQRKTTGAGVDVLPYPWWERAAGVGGTLDGKLKERLEVCRMLVGGLDGVRNM